MKASYAAHSEQSRGRLYAEPAVQYRTEFQRDRDRIIHSTAFRRLEYKTQVFVNHEGDLYRTRLTHSVEVAQIARSIARNLRLDEDLTEAIALAHDLGHTPFGHAGQDALNACMKAFGGFEHNLQSLRVVDLLEEKYAEFPGLNLTFEAREGVLKHCSLPNARQLGGVGERFIEKTQPSLEAQLTNLADEIAYNNHDIDDGLRSGLITIEQLCELSLFAESHDEVMAKYPDLTGRRIVHEVLRRMINRMIVDLTVTTQQRIDASNIQTIDDVRQQPKPLVRYSEALDESRRELKRFLLKNLYQHYQVNRMTIKANKVVSDLFDAFFHTPNVLPHEYQEKISDQGGADITKARVIADYIAGMTDRYAMKEYHRLFEIHAGDL
jgi:dGTPase